MMNKSTLSILVLLSSLNSYAASKHTGELLFKVKKDDKNLNLKSLNSIYAKYGINNKSINSNEIVNVYKPSQESIDLKEVQKDMIKSGAFEFVEYNTYEHEIGNDKTSIPSTNLSQYHHELADTQKAWTLSEGEGAVVAVCDSGVESGHEDLKENILKEGAWDFVDNDNHANAATGHGTFVAGLIAASASNGIGIAGMAPKSKILPLRIATTQGGTTIKRIADCIKYAADQGAKIINVSFTGVNTDTVAAAGKYANSKGSLLIYAAGNAGRNKRWSDRKYVLAVGGSTAKDSLWRYRKCKARVICYTLGSNAGAFIDLVAPGHKLTSTNTYIDRNVGGEKYRISSGTSYSAPIISGVAALIASARPDLGPLEIEDILEKSADKIGSGSEYYYGAGRVNAFEAVKMALDY